MIFEKIKTIISEQLNIEEDKINLDTHFQNDLEADSLDLFQVVNEIEDEFDIEIDTDQSMETIKELVDYVTQLTK